MKLVRLSILTLAAFISACSNNDESEAQGLNKIRATAIQEAALTYGARYALSWRARSIERDLNEHSLDLDKIFNFRELVMDNHVMPPILQKSDDSFNLSNPNAIRLSDSVIEIIMPARFVTTTPTWLDYLNFSMYQKPDEPDDTVLPKTSEEKAYWDKYVKLGWDQGKAQADDIFLRSLMRLTRDFNGMSLYRKLYTMHMISAPFVSKANLGITGDTAKMRLNDQVIRITKPSELQPSKAKSWKPVIVQR